MTSPNTDPTFRNYTSSQAQAYASHRPPYSSKLYETVLEHHEKTGGKFNILLDLGCGPGNATRDMAGYFEEAIGCDAGAAMIETAREIWVNTLSARDIRWVVGSGEEFAGLGEVRGEEVDLITVAMAVHWFDMDKFWAQAARALKPGGTVALWTRGSTLSSFYPHPSTPNRKQLLQIFTNLEHKILAPYELPANRLSRDMYDHLPLPWNIPHPIPASTFPPWQFLKLDFDREGILSDAKSNDFFGGGREVTLKDVEETLGTANMVTRWREAHAEKAETEEDILKLHIEEVRKVMGGKESMLVGSSTAIIFVKKAIEEA